MTRIEAASARYTATAQWLHWVVALLIIGNFWLGITMVDIPGITPTKLKYFNWHKWMGVTIFGLVCVRLLWRVFHAPPPLPMTMPAWQRASAHLSHIALYVLMFAIPLTGYFYSLAAGFPIVYLGVLPLPVLMDPNPELKGVLKEAHEVLAWMLAGVLVVHVMAALKHHWVDRDEVLARMLPKRLKI
ncbi:MAG TPA: cytochrome b [Burkholderiaceae bacterium]|nr:cytochrome b [Burkholderiaceae bacterium]